MNEKFNEIIQEILKAIGEQNKRFENLEEKIEKITVEKVKEFLSSDDIVIEDSKPQTEKIVLTGIENKIKELKENIFTKEEYQILENKVVSLENENKELKEKLMNLEEKLKKTADYFEKIEEISKKLQNIEKNSKIKSDDTEVKSADSEIGDLAVKKDGKVVNIVINV